MATMTKSFILDFFIYNDGGRSKAGYKGFTGDCATRSIAIATGIPYEKIYAKFILLSKSEKTGKRKKGISHPRTGIYTRTFRKFMESIGWEWIPTMKIGSGCKVHLNADELPSGRLVVRVSRHYVCMIDGVIHDLFDPSRSGTRCVYGYYKKKES